MFPPRIERAQEVDVRRHRLPRADHGACEAGSRCPSAATRAPSPAPVATRFVDPCRTSPTAKIPGALVSIVKGGRRNGQRSRDVRGGDAVAPLKRSLEVPHCSVVLDEAENRRSLLAAAHSQKLRLGVKRPEPDSPRALPPSSKVTVNQPEETRSRCDHAAAVFVAATGRTGWRGQPCDPALGQPRPSSGMMDPAVTVRSSPRCSRGGRRRPRAALPSR